MISTNQNTALAPAHGQPSASNRPKNARRRAAGLRAGSAVCAIGQPPTLRVPVMFGWTVHMNV